MAAVTWAVCLLMIGCAVGSLQQCDLESSMDNLINAGMASRGIPGLSIAVVKNGALALSKGYGVKDVDTGEPVTADTLFGIASLTKAFASTFLTKLLREQSSYTPSTNIYKILGRSQTKFNNTLRSTYATVEDLMSHSMGIPRNNFMRLDTDLTRENLMSRLKYLPSYGAFRRSYFYNDLMYGLLTRITEVVGGSGQTWEQLMTSNFFQPLGMMNSTFSTVANFSDPQIATPYALNRNNQPYKLDTDFIKFYAGIGGAGSIMSTANDMAKYLLFHLNGGKNALGQSVMRQSDLERTYRPLNAINSVKYSKPDFPQTMSNDGYALGWRIGYYKGHKLIEHTGSTYGYKAMITILPQTSSAIFTAFSGSDDGSHFRTAIHSAALDLVLEESPWINTTTIRTFPHPWESSKRKRRSVESGKSFSEHGDEDKEEDIDDGEDSDVFSLGDDDEWNDLHPLDNVSGSRVRQPRPKRSVTQVGGVPILNFAGTFKHGAYGTVNIAFDATSSKLKMDYGFGQWELEYTGSGYKFKCDWLGRSPTFDIEVEFLVRGDVYGFKCLDCDGSYKPAFYRQN